MTNDEINKFIHERILGKCLHQGHCVYDYKARRLNCGKCGAENVPYITRWPDYCSDDSPRSLLNEVVAMVDLSELCLYLPAPPACLRATAEQIARACVEAWEARESPELVR